MTDDAEESAGETADAGDDAGASIEPDPEALSNEELGYPTFEFPSGGVDTDGSFSLSRELEFDGMAEWLRDLAAAMDTHDLAVAGEDRQAIFGVGPDAVEMSFDADEAHRGELEVTVRLRAKAMTVDDADAPQAGARGGTGFVPVEMLTGDRDPGDFRCYNWIDDPGADE